MTNDPRLLKILQSELALMSRAASALQRSWNECKEINLSNVDMEETDRLELLSSRFSRLTDYMIQRIFRLIDELDLEAGGTVRDIINRAEKKGLIENADSFVHARILRNKIAHEYVEKVMTEIFKEVIKCVPLLLDDVMRTQIYCQHNYQG